MKPEREAGDDPRVERLERADVEEHAGLADDEHEADGHHDRDQDEQARTRPSPRPGSAARSTTPGARPPSRPSDPHRNGGERAPPQRRRERDARHHAGDGRADIRHRQQLGAVRLEEDRARGDHDPRHREAERKSLPGQQDDPRVRRLASLLGSGHASAVSTSSVGDACSSRARVEITPRAISGRSSSSSSNGPAPEPQQQARLDRGHRGRSRRRREHRELADDAAGAGLDQRPFADVDADPARRDDEQPVLDARRAR